MPLQGKTGWAQGVGSRIDSPVWQKLTVGVEANRTLNPISHIE